MPSKPRSKAQIAAQSLVHFKPEQSGSPSGRRKDHPNFAAAMDLMLVATDPVTKRTVLDEVVRALLEACLRAEPWAMEVLLKRLWPVQLGVNLNAQVAVVPDPNAALDELERSLAVYSSRRDAEPEVQ